MCLGYIFVSTKQTFLYLKYIYFSIRIYSIYIRTIKIKKINRYDKLKCSINYFRINSTSWQVN